MATHKDQHSTRQLHFLLLPFHMQSHLNPILSFASKLVLENCKVTCVLTERLQRTMLNASADSDHHSASASGIRFVTIPDGLPADYGKLDLSTESLVRTLIGMKQQEGMLNSIVESSKATSSPISCIVSDFMFPWVQDVANKFSIPRALFWTCSAVTFHVSSLDKAGVMYPGSPNLQALDRKLHVGPRTILDIFYREERKETDPILQIFERLDEASHILMNSFGTLEEFLQPSLPANTRFIGPCLPADFVDKLGMTAASTTTTTTAATTTTRRLGSLLKEDLDCLQWLDRQEERSVLFISFGSVAFSPPSQIEEIALGLEASSHKFLWVARPDTEARSKFPEGFVERTKNKGLVIPWAPQLQVLNHPALGGFLTHCGWNSTLESIFMGVPMLCLPISVDQPLNAQLIEKQYGVGMGFTRQDNGIASREEIERVVRALMEGEEGCKLRARALELREEARNSLSHEAGSSRVALASFIKDIAFDANA